MKHSILAATMLAAMALSACDRPTVVTAVPAVVAVPGPPGATGATGATGSQGDTGKPGQGATVVVVTPAASAPN